MIRDRIVVGLQDSKLSEKLQLDPDLTLTKAINQARQSETVKKQQTLLRSDFKESTETMKEVDAIKSRKTPKFKKESASSGTKKPFKNTSTNPPSTRCDRCGKSPGHKRTNCPAKEAICHKCSKRGHWGAVCKSSKIYKTLQPLPSLTESSKTLFGPAETSLPVRGFFMGTIQRGDQTSQQEIFVVTGAHQALLGRPAIEAFNVVERVNDVEAKDFKTKYPKLFKELGKLHGPDYIIKLKPDAKPHALCTPRRVPVPLLSKVREEISRMEKMEIISEVDEPTEWCAGMVVVPKPNGKVRICVDLTRLNESILREFHPLPSVDHTLAHLSGATVFSKLDANSGFWQIGLSQESAKLTTFITPFGRFCFNRLPFGISSAPEHFQKRISQVLEGTDAALCLMDDILVYGTSVKEHDEHLETTLLKLQDANLTLNEEKCVFSRPSVEFLGNIIDSKGVRATPKKVEAILEMKAPKDQTELRRFLGMVNQLSKFQPQIAELSKPLRDLLSSKNQWSWDTAQQHAFSALKKSLTTTPTLAHYDARRETTLATDASSYGLGAVLRQKQDDSQWRPVAYASRAMTPTEQRYAQIEKEALGITWASERFADYLIGLQYHIETDHKP